MPAATAQSPLLLLSTVIPPISVKTITLCLLWYFVSSVSSQITKHILNEFPFPLALGEFQFFIVFSLSLVTILVLPRFPRLHSLFPEGQVPSLNGPALQLPNKHILVTVLPLGAFQFLGKLFSHSATALVPVSTVAGIKTLSPLILVSTYRALYHVKFPVWTYLSLLPLVLGILLIVVEDANDTLVSTTASTRYIGILYATLSLVVFVAQNIYGKTVFTYNQKHLNNHAELALAQSDEKTEDLPVSERKYIAMDKRAQSYASEAEKSTIPSFPKVRNKYDKMTLLIYCSALGGLMSLPWFLYIEAPHFLKLTSALEDVTEAQVVFIPWTLLFINGISHFFQSLIAFHLLGALPTVTYSIASMMKKITVIVVSMLYTGHHISTTQFLGLGLTTAGLYTYDRWGGKAAKSSK